MSTDESLERQSRSESVSADAIDWGSQFVKHLELEYTSVASRLPTEATWEEFRQAMLRAVLATLLEAGSDLDEISQLLHETPPVNHGPDDAAGWTDECNIRRIALIDKMLQQTLSAKEAVELDRLTARLRLHADSEDLVPIEGARRLHKRLLEMSIPKPTSR
jgi:hypothetical protein